MSIPYDLLDVEWGEEILRARPIAWNQDLTAEDINPEEAEGILVTAYELVCPDCGGRCEFKVEDSEIRCDDCNSSTDNPVFERNFIENEDMAPWESEENEEANPDQEENEDEDIVKDIEKVKGSSKEPKSPENILDSLTESITNTEISLEEPDEEDRKEVEESKQSIKTKKKSKKKSK